MDYKKMNYEARVQTLILDFQQCIDYVYIGQFLRLDETIEVAEIMSGINVKRKFKGSNTAARLFET